MDPNSSNPFLTVTMGAPRLDVFDNGIPMISEDETTPLIAPSIPSPIPHTGLPPPHASVHSDSSPFPVPHILVDEPTPLFAPSIPNPIPHMGILPPHVGVHRSPYPALRSLATDNKVHIVHAPDKLSIRKYSGYNHEDGQKFLSEFESYLLFINIDHTSARAVVSFHLNIQGPALIWFNSLTDEEKCNWPILKAAFIKEFCPPDGRTFIAEEAIFRNLQLGSQPIEDYHSIIMEKGRRLGKPDRDRYSPENQTRSSPETDHKWSSVFSAGSRRTCTERYMGFSFKPEF